MLLRCVRKQRDRARTLERGGQRPLVPRARTGHAARQDLAPVADEPAQPGDLLVVDVVDLLGAERAYLAMLPLRPARSLGTGTLARRRVVISCGWSGNCHG